MNENLNFCAMMYRMAVMMCCDLLLANGHLMRVMFWFRVHIKNHRVCILSLDTIGHVMRWCDITKNSFTFSHDSQWHGINSVMLHLKIQVAFNSNILQIENKFNKINQILLYGPFDVLGVF